MNDSTLYCEVACYGIMFSSPEYVSEMLYLKRNSDVPPSLRVSSQRESPERARGRVRVRACARCPSLRIIAWQEGMLAF